MAITVIIYYYRPKDFSPMIFSRLFFFFKNLFYFFLKSWPREQTKLNFQFTGRRKPVRYLVQAFQLLLTQIKLRSATLDV